MRSVLVARPLGPRLVDAAGSGKGSSSSTVPFAVICRLENPKTLIKTEPTLVAQVADPTFFMKMLPLLDDGDDIAMVLSPQCFHNVHHQTDIFNHTNIHFWEYMQVGYDALGFISCTGAPLCIFSRRCCMALILFHACLWSRAAHGAASCLSLAAVGFEAPGAGSGAGVQSVLVCILVCPQAVACVFLTGTVALVQVPTSSSAPPRSRSAAGHPIGR